MRTAFKPGFTIEPDSFRSYAIAVAMTLTASTLGVVAALIPYINF